MMYEACLFDLDGTLVDSLTDLAVSANQALRTQGYPVHEVEEYRFFVGRGVAKLIEAVLPEEARTPEIQVKTRSLFDELYGVHYLDNTLPYPGIPELLAELQRRKIRMAVVSNKPDAFTKKIVTGLFGGLFQAVLGQRDGIPRKPDPAIVSDACRILGVQPARCLYLGDSGVDMQTAKAADAFAVGALWGFRSENELIDNGAAKLIQTPAELLPLLQG